MNAEIDNKSLLTDTTFELNLVQPSLKCNYSKKNSYEILEILRENNFLTIDLQKSDKEQISRRISKKFEIEKTDSEACADEIIRRTQSIRNELDTKTKLIDGRGGANDEIAWLPTGEGRYAIQKENTRALVPIELLKDGQLYCCFDNYVVTNPIKSTGELLKLPTSWWNEWAEGKHEPKAGVELFNKTLKAFSIFHDVPSKADVLMQTIQVLQSYARFRISAYPRYSVTAKRGSGKSVQIETIAELSLGGRFASNISAASYARDQARELCAWSVDELDSLVLSRKGEAEDHPLVQAARQGYRPGATYTRFNADVGRNETIPIDSPMQYTAINDVDSQLQSRGTKTELLPSTDKNLPLMHSPRIKSLWLQKLKGQLVSWFLANAKSNVLSEQNFDLDNLVGEISENRKTIGDSALIGFSDYEKDFILKYGARTEELALSIVEIGHVFGLSAEDYSNISSMLDAVQEELNQPAEGLALELFEVLKKKFESPLVTEVTQSELFKELSSKAGIPVGNKRQRGLLREAGVPMSAVVKKGSEPRKILRTPDLLVALGFQDNKDDKSDKSDKTRNPPDSEKNENEKNEEGGSLGHIGISDISSLSDKLRALEVDGLIPTSNLESVREHAGLINRMIHETGELIKYEKGWKFQPKGVSA